MKRTAETYVTQYSHDDPDGTFGETVVVEYDTDWNEETIARKVQLAFDRAAKIDNDGYELAHVVKLNDFWQVTLANERMMIAVLLFEL